MVEIPCKNRDRPKEKTTIRVPVILPHELLNWLAENDRFRVDQAMIKKFWERWEQFKPPHPASAAGCHNPLAITGDDARYTLGGSKVIVIAMSMVLLDRMKWRTNDFMYSPLEPCSGYNCFFLLWNLWITPRYFTLKKLDGKQFRLGH